MEAELIHMINKQLDTDIGEDIQMPELEQKLIAFINTLIQHDFQKLVFLLYKIDVDENKLKKILKEEVGTDSANIIARLIIEREIQKIKTRKQFRQKNN